MTASETLEGLRASRFFESWDGSIAPEHIEASEGILCRLIDDLIALGPDRTEDATRRVVEACVQRFNEIDDGWICTIEREDIYEQVGRVVDVCGFEYDEDWLDGRDW